MTKSKTILIVVVFAALLSGVALTGCSKNGQDTPSSERTIRLHAGLQVASKAAVNTGNTFTAAIGGWESASGAADYSATKAWLSTSTITASETTGNITLSPAQYYSQNGTVKTYIKAWYPAGTLSDGGTVHFGGTPDGTTDVLLATEVSGSALDAGSRDLIFTHRLSQLKFTVQGDEEFGAATVIKSITIKDAALPTGIDLKTDAVVYAPDNEMTVPGIAGTQTVTPEKTPVGTCVMLKPFASNSFKIDVETSKTTYRNVVVTIDNDASFIPGKAYTIGLSFAGYGISTAASVIPWDNTGTGGGDINTDE